MTSDVRDALHKELHALPDGWRWEWFMDVFNIEGGTQPPKSTFVDTPQPGYVRLVQIRDFETDSHLTYIRDAKKWRKCKEDDVLIARYGAALGRICRGLEGAYNVALAKVIVPDTCDRRFVYYLLCSKYFQDPILSGGGRSAQAGFNKENLAVIPLPLPPLSEQRAIAEVLGSLDDKIELNRRMNRTLESMARALFKSWFVDFDPVHANAAGQPTLPPDLAALFPASFEPSALGEIPEGWEAGTLGDVLKTKKRAVAVDDLDEETAYIGLEHMPRRSLNLDQWDTAADLKSNKNGFERGDILFGKLRPYFHKVGIAPVDGVCSTDMLVLGPKSPAWFAYCACQCFSDPLIAHATALSNGAKMPRTKWADIRDYEVALPPEILARHFNDKLRPLFDRILANIYESRTLAALRDAMLPKLIGGAICIRGVLG